MLKNGGLQNLHSMPFLPILPSKIPPLCPVANICFTSRGALKLQNQRIQSMCLAARRRVRYEEEEQEDGEEEEEYGHNSDLTMLESYSESVKNEALLVRAMVDEQEEEVLIFKGISSCLSYRTSPDPSRSVLPTRAVITSIDRIKGPFNPSNIEYLEKGLTWETFKSRLQSN